MHQWVKVPGYLLEVTRNGLVRNARGRILKQGLSSDGYRQVGYIHSVGRTTARVHRLIALAFIPNLHNKPQINHIDGNKQNNSISNLEWCTNSENTIHAYRILGVGKKNRLGKVSNRLKGVTRNHSGYMSRIRVDNKLIHLGTFKTKEEAALAYNEAALKYHIKPILNEV